MKTRTKVISTTVVLFFLAAFALSLYGAANSLAQGNEPEATQPAAEESNPEAEQEKSDSLDNSSNPNRGEVEFIPRTAIEAALATAVGDDVLTQAEADKILVDIGSTQEVDLTFFRAAPLAGVRLRSFGLDGTAPGTITLAHPDFFHALQQAVLEDVLTWEDVRAIMDDFTASVGGSYNLEVSGSEASEEELLLTFDLSITGDQEELQAAMAAALDKAVADGRLTAEEAADILLNAETVEPSALPELFFLEEMRGIPMHRFEGSERGSVIIARQLDNLLAALATHLEAAVAEGRITQEEVDGLLQALEEVLKE